MIYLANWILNKIHIFVKFSFSSTSSLKDESKIMPYFSKTPVDHWIQNSSLRSWHNWNWACQKIFCAEAKMMDVSSWLKITIRPRVVYCAEFHLSPLRISYCCADALFSHVFAFIAMNKDETMECHAFLCRKRKIVIILPFIFKIVNLLLLGSSCISDSRSSI